MRRLLLPSVLLSSLLAGGLLPACTVPPTRRSVPEETRPSLCLQIIPDAYLTGVTIGSGIELRSCAWTDNPVPVGTLVGGLEYLGWTVETGGPGLYGSGVTTGGRMRTQGFVLGVWRNTEHGQLIIVPVLPDVDPGSAPPTSRFSMLRPPGTQIGHVEFVQGAAR